MNKEQKLESILFPCGKEFTTLQYAPSGECAIAPHRDDQIGHDRRLSLVVMLNKKWGWGK